MPMPMPGNPADRIRQMQRMRAGQDIVGYTPETPSIDVGELDMSPHEMDIPSQSPIPDQDHLDSITRQMAAYSYNPAAPKRDDDGSMTWGPQYAKIPGATWRR